MHRHTITIGYQTAGRGEKKQQKPFDKLSNGVSVIVRTSGEKWETHKERQIPKGNTIPHLDVPIKQPDLLLSCLPSGSRIKVLYEGRHSRNNNPQCMLQ